MKIGIIGAGAAGLTAAYDLVRQGHQVTILERNHELGGLAASVDVNGTRLERFYHHIFASDTVIIDMIKELGLESKLFWRALPTGVYNDGKLYDFGTPVEMLKFPALPFIDRMRLLASSAYLKFFPNWKPLEKVHALTWSRKWAGKKATAVMWEPLLRGKFGADAEKISMAWLWARIHSRTFKLGYMDGSFDLIYAALAERVEKAGGTILYEQTVDSITQADANEPVVVTSNATEHQFDRVITTTSQPEFARATGAADSSELLKNHYLGATCFILEMDQSLIPHYWLNINDESFPFLAVVEHTKLVDKAQYGGKYVVYVGNYVAREDWRFTEDPAVLLEKFIPYLQQLNPAFDASWITNWQFSKAPFAQPIVTPDYHNHIPPHTTHLPGVFLATMAQVYPQDRGQNYSIKIGHEVAELATK